MLTVPSDLQRIHYLEQPSSVSLARRRLTNEAVEFQVACIKELDQESVTASEEHSDHLKTSEEHLKLHSEEYANLIRKYPQLMNPNFVKGEPVHGVWHRIETGDHPPSRAKRWPIIADSEKAEKGRKAWMKMEKDGIIERVKAGDNTDWSSALHIAPKPGGGARPCSDFRDLNSKTICDSYPLPLLRDFTGKIHGCKVFSVIDLRSAFFNIPIWPAHRYKTTTLSPWGGAYVYNRLPFGLSSGPATWQKTLETILKDIDGTFIYLDDCLIFAKDKETHDKIVEEVFKRLASNNMALSIDKCKFGKDKVDYLGYSVTFTGILPLPRKLAALKNFKHPQSQKDVLHFCGALNYFWTSLRGIKKNGKWKSAAEVLQPLYAIGTEKLPSKGKFKEIWSSSPALIRAFGEAKEMLMNAAELYPPNPNYPVVLFTDASDHSVGGLLQMMSPDGIFHPLGFYSAHLTPTQKKYSTFKKELLGAHKSLRHFLPEVYGRHLTIYTDCLPLQQAFKSQSIPLHNPQTYRQITEISQFTRDVKHVSWVNNVFADFLSRMPEESERGMAYLPVQDEDLIPVEEVASTETLRLQVACLPSIQDIQKTCPEIKKILSGDKPKNTSFGYVKVEGLEVFCEISSDPRVYVPQLMRDQIMKALHFDHLGERSTLHRIAEEYYWPSLKHDVKRFCKQCVPCQKVKPNKRLVNTGSFRVPDKRFSHVMVDVVGPLPPHRIVILKRLYGF